MEPLIKAIPNGNTKEDKKQRKQFIIDFYGKWIAENPEKQIYNKSLQTFIVVRFLSIEETAQHASFNYKSTMAITFLSEILENAIVKKDKNPRRSRNSYHLLFLEFYCKDNRFF